MREGWQLELGARAMEGNRVRFTVWAPFAKTATLEVEGRAPLPMQPCREGYFDIIANDTGPGARYRYRLDGTSAYPDPASRCQPEGVHGPSMVVDPTSFRWSDGSWAGMPLDDLIIYELHVGTFTEAGTFEAIIPHLPYLKETVGITAIELMPVAQCPGRRNWGYDGVYPYAVQWNYGGPDGLKRLVDACHAAGLAVILDVVYNHLGPEGNYLGAFGPYFTERYRTPWGAAVNYDGPDSDPVRQYIVENALYWTTEYHIDGLRLDAIHGIYDFGATHILAELSAAVRQQAALLNRTIVVIAESDLNDTRVIDDPAQGGYGIDAQWSDDFHHALRVTLTGEQEGYYRDYQGMVDLVTAIQEGFVYSGRYSRYRRRRHGNSARHCVPSQFVVFSQNHDQIGNRAVGDRLSMHLSCDAMKAARALVLLSPYIPLLFMGEEYGETAPFQYFIEHGDPALIEAVRQGRRREFAPFGWKPEEIPDPQSPATFERSRVHLQQRTEWQEALLRWTGALIRLRKTHPALGAGEGKQRHHSVWVVNDQPVLVLHRWAKGGEQERALLVLGLNRQSMTVVLTEPAGRWMRQFDSAAPEFGGQDQAPLPKDLLIHSQGVQLSMAPYQTTLYVGV
ncbi:MAG: malto-oligosyltrehalose trehalohydrolase [Nitrospiraceae bacterium]|nr:malto-oligosyltrehalose trehalohydrolase [Nitrospiraceae bacterium]